MREDVRLTSWGDVLARLDALEGARGAKTVGAWTLPQVITHCAQSIECSIRGFPRHRSSLFQKTVGRIALRKFLRQGYMRHDLAAPIPGAEALALDVTLGDALRRMRAAIRAFEEHRGDFAPHFAYGPVERADYERVHAMHFAHHLSQVVVDS